MFKLFKSSVLLCFFGALCSMSVRPVDGQELTWPSKLGFSQEKTLGLIPISIETIEITGLEQTRIDEASLDFTVQASLDDYLRIEGDFLYTGSSSKSILSALVPTVDEAPSLAVMISAIYDVDIDSVLKPYVGFGAGFKTIDTDFSTLTSFVSPSADFLYKLELGMDYALSTDTDLFILGKYQYLNRYSESLMFSDHLFDYEFDGTVMSLGVRHSF